MCKIQKSSLHHQSDQPPSIQCRGRRHGSRELMALQSCSLVGKGAPYHINWYPFNQWMLTPRLRPTPRAPKPVCSASAVSEVSVLSLVNYSWLMMSRSGSQSQPRPALFRCRSVLFTLAEKHWYPFCEVPRLHCDPLGGAWMLRESERGYWIQYNYQWLSVEINRTDLYNGTALVATGCTYNARDCFRFFSTISASFHSSLGSLLQIRCRKLSFIQVRKY